MNNICDGEEPAYESKQDTHTHTHTHRREIGTKETFYFLIATVTIDNQPLLKVTRSLYIVTNLGKLPFMLFT